MIRILIIDDHPLFLAGVQQILKHSFPEAKLLPCINFSDSLPILSEEVIDIILLDLNLPDKHGLDVLAFLAEKFPEIPVAILTASEEKQDLDQALASGAKGYIPKTTSPDKIAPLIQQIIKGDHYFPDLKDGQMSLAEQFDLTSRQVEILVLIADGLSNKQIADTLFISEGTVKQHINAIFRALDVKNRTQASLIVKKYL